MNVFTCSRKASTPWTLADKNFVTRLLYKDIY